MKKPYKKQLGGDYRMLQLPILVKDHTRIHDIAKASGMSVRHRLRKSIHMLINDIESGDVKVSANVERTGK